MTFRNSVSSIFYTEHCGRKSLELYSFNPATDTEFNTRVLAFFWHFHPLLSHYFELPFYSGRTMPSKNKRNQSKCHGNHSRLLFACNVGFVRYVNVTEGLVKLQKENEWRQTVWGNGVESKWSLRIMNFKSTLSFSMCYQPKRVFSLFFCQRQSL